MYRVNVQVADEILRFSKDFYVPDRLLLTEPREICFRIKELMIRKEETLSGAESVTGGIISSLITDIPGSSDYFSGCAVVYTEQAKMKLLGISRELIKKYGVVSENIVREMAKNSRYLFESGFSYGSTGYAGPEGGNGVKVGTVWLGFQLPDESVFTWKASFKGERVEVRQLSSDLAVRCLYILALNFLKEER